MTRTVRLSVTTMGQVQPSVKVLTYNMSSGSRTATFLPGYDSNTLRMSDSELLRSSACFSSLSDDEHHRVSNLLTELRLERNEMIFFEGEQGGWLYTVISGAVKLFKTSTDGKIQILSLVLPGKSFDDLAMVGTQSSPISAQAMMPSVVYRVKRSDLETMLTECPQLARNIINVLADQARQYFSLIGDLSFSPVIGRLAKILLEYGGTMASANHIRLSQSDMAAMAGSLRETIGRSLRALKDAGIIKQDRELIIIINSEALKTLAGIS